MAVDEDSQAASRQAANKNAMQRALAFTADAVLVTIEAVRIGRKHGKVSIGNIPAVQVWRDGGMDTPGYAGSQLAGATAVGGWDLHVHEHLTILSTLAGKAPLARGKALLANVQKACHGQNTSLPRRTFNLADRGQPLSECAVRGID